MKKDYLALIRIGGGSSYGRDSNVFDAVEGAVRFCVLDWSRYYKLEGMVIAVEVYDVTGRDEIVWGDGIAGVQCVDGEIVDTIDRLKVIEVELPELTGRQKINGPKYLHQAAHAVSRACSEIAA